MRKFSAIKSAVASKIKSFFKLSTLKKPPVLYKTFLFLLFGYLLIKVPFNLPNTILMPFYFLAALAGLRLYRIQNYKVYFLTQLGFLLITGYLLSIGPIYNLGEQFSSLVVSVHSILFLAAYSFFIFFIVFTIFNSIKSSKKQRNTFIIFQHYSG